MKRTLPLLALLVAPLAFYTDRNTCKFYFTFSYGNHTEVFHYLWDVKNFPVINPTIFALEVRQRNSAEIHVIYRECLSHFRGVTNVGFARYEMLSNDDGSRDITSVHLTCFVGEYFCLPTSSRVRVHGRRNEISYEETIEYACPWILRPFCLREISFQRMLIMSNLKETFSECPA